MSVRSVASRMARGYHKSPDAQYDKLWKKRGVSFLDRMDSRQEWNPGHNFYQSPRRVRQVMQAQIALREKGLVTFVHAMPAAYALLIDFFKAAYPVEKSDFVYLRSPTDQLYKRKRHELEPPQSGVQNSAYLSMSYSLCSGVRELESAASWGFVNHFGPSQNLAVMDVFSRFLSSCKLDKNVEEHAYFFNRGFELIRAYSRLQVGEFLVIGVPEKSVDRFVYDSRPYNLPTGKKASAIAADPEADTEMLDKELTHMATMPLCDEVMDPASGLVVVSVRDHALSSMEEAPFLAEITSSVDTDFEARQEALRAQLDRQKDEFVSEFQQFLAKKPVDFQRWKPDETFYPGDFEGVLI